LRKMIKITNRITPPASAISKADIPYSSSKFSDAYSN
jgi:hypothetical protein